MSLLIRQATEADLPALARVGAQAFPQRDAAARLAQLREDPRMRPEDTLVAEEDGAIRGTARVLPLTIWWGGAAWPMGGLASVAVAPEARRRGVARALCEAAVQRLRERGVPLCLLFPFDHRFYAALGWTLVGLSRQATVPCSALPRGASGEVIWLDPLTRGEEIRACHAQWLRARGVGLERHPLTWSGLLKERWQWFGVPGREGLRGYAAVAYHPTAEELTQDLEVGEIVALDAAAHRALLGWLGCQAAQIERVTLTVPAETPLETLLVNPRAHGETSVGCGTFPCSRLCAGAMIRVLDWSRLLGGARPRPHWLRCSVGLALSAGGGGGAWLLNQDSQWVEVDQLQAEITVTLDEPTLTQITWGALTLSQAVACGRAEVRGAEDLRSLDALMSQPPLFIPRWDAF